MRFLALLLFLLPTASSAADTPPQGEARRNENVAVYQMDTNAIKEANVRLGASVTIVTEAVVETTWFATEHGQPPGGSAILPRAGASSARHGEVYWRHQNGFFNARTFFQVGEVLPSRRNAYGGRYTDNLGKPGWLTLNASQSKIRGMVNGNVLVPLASERTPLTTDPAAAALITRYLAAYPASLPNRPDFDPRALNTNAPQRSDETNADARLDRDLGKNRRISAFYSLGRQRVDAFQLVAGQNPDTEIHSHRARLSWRQSLSPSTDLAWGANFQRARSVLLPEPNAVGPRLRFGYQIEELGPESQFPVDRAQNTFSLGALLARQAAGGHHSLTFGAELFRYQLNGIETNNQRGVFQFGNNFGRTAIDNLRYGTASSYEVTIGELARGYRNWSANMFFGDRWRVGPRLQIYYGLRYGLETTPSEVNRMETIPYPCDCNNFSPRFSLAYSAPAGWVMRASYNVSFGQIPQVTYQQIRSNLPHVRYLIIANPDLVSPLRGIDLNSPQLRNSPTILSPDLVAPYSHQYNFSLERRLAGGVLLRTGYVGSRTFKMPTAYVLNRAVPVSGIPLTTANVDQRRPDPRYYEVKDVANGGIAYLDAAQASLEFPTRKGLAWGATYTFGKAIDEGTDYSSTAANADMQRQRSQSQYFSVGDRRGLSNFDSTHSLAVYFAYELPRGWQMSGAALMKSGTPLTLFVGSDAPGFGNVDGTSGDRPNIMDPSILGMTISHPDTSAIILRRDRFAYIAPGEERGNLGRNTFRKAGIANFNAAVTKQFRWTAWREWTALLRAEAFNLTNHPQFDEPQRNLSSPSFGQITNTLNDGRVLQFGLRLVL